MNMLKRIAVTFVVIAFASLASFAHADEGGPATQPAADVEKTHNELRAMRDKIIAAINANDVAAMLDLVSDDILYTPQNAETCRGKAEVKKYYDKMMTGPSRVVESIQVKVEVDKLSTLLGAGDTALATGDSRESFRLTNGMNFELKSRWTAVVAREGGAWRIKAFHVSANIFDNAVLSEYVGKLKRALVIVAVAGIVMGFGMGWGLARRGKAKA